MPKRFCDTDIWKNQRWFRKLSPTYKLAFCYIRDECSHSGIWKIDCTDLIEDLGIDEFDILHFVDAINVEYDKLSGKKVLKERVRIIENNLLWITGFIQFQYEGKDGYVNPDASPVRTALMSLEGFGTLVEGLQKFIKIKEPLREGWRTPKDKVKDKDKKGGVGENKKPPKAESIKNGRAIFSDGSEQELGESQIMDFEGGRLSPRQVVKGHVY